MDIERRREAYIAVERLTELPMLLLAVAIIPLLLVPALFDVSSGTENLLETTQWVIWSLFAGELMVKTYLSEDRPVYLKQHWFDVLIVVLPFLRPLRVLRSTRALRSLRALRVVAVAGRVTHSSQALLGRRGIQYVLVTGLLLFVVSSVLVYQFEKSADGNISGLGDALWWAMATITTVGYGDRFPVTAEGRGVAVFLMLAGISLFGFLTANIAAFLVQTSEDEDEPSLKDVMAEIRALKGQLEEMQASLPTPLTPDNA